MRGDAMSSRSASHAKSAFAQGRRIALLSAGDRNFHVGRSAFVHMAGIAKLFSHRSISGQLAFARISRPLAIVRTSGPRWFLLGVLTCIFACLLPASAGGFATQATEHWAGFQAGAGAPLAFAETGVFGAGADAADAGDEPDATNVGADAAGAGADGTGSASNRRYLLVKDGYRIPSALDGEGNSLAKDGRTGIFVTGNRFAADYAGAEDAAAGDAALDGAASGDSADDAAADVAAVDDGALGGEYTEDERRYYLAMRWEYAGYDTDERTYSTNGQRTCGVHMSGDLDSEQRVWTEKRRVAVRNPENGRIVICSAVAWGPAQANRYGELSPDAMDYLTEGREDANQAWPQFEVLGWCNDEGQPLGPTTLGPDSAGDVEQAVAWMEAGCNDDTVGYSQTGRDSVRSYDGSAQLNADCSSYVYWALVRGGSFFGLYRLQGESAFITGQQDELLALGWKKYPIQDLSELRRGDFLWWSDTDVVGHTEIYVGNGMSAGAWLDENGGIKDGAPGDQTGAECRVINPQGGMASRFTHYYRFEPTGE